VPPDVEVEEDPALGARGIDNQLDRAIEVVMEDIDEKAWKDVPEPERPDRSGAGVLPEDR
jgi:hypothetical protein